MSRKGIDATITLLGKLDIDETKTHTISSRVSGRLDRLYVTYTGQQVRKGEYLAMVYSPELVIAQKEMIDTFGTTLEASTREKLQLLGFTAAQINRLKTTRKIQNQTTIYAPVSGIVTTKRVSEGQYVEAGEPLYTIDDTKELWLILDAYEADMGKLHPGQEVRFQINAVPEDTFSGKVATVQPALDMATRTVKVRVTLTNPSGNLKPGMLATAKIITSVQKGSQLAIPETAPLIAGERAIVYVKTKPDAFESREVILGEKTNGFYAVKSGLNPGEEIVTKGNFYIDSAMQIQGKPSLMTPEAGQ